MPRGRRASTSSAGSAAATWRRSGRSPRHGRRWRCGTPTSGSTAPTRPRPRPAKPAVAWSMEPFDVMDSGRMAVVTDPEGRRVLRLAGEGPQGCAGRQRARLAELQRSRHPRRRTAPRRSTARCSAGRRSTAGVDVDAARLRRSPRGTQPRPCASRWPRWAARRGSSTSSPRSTRSQRRRLRHAGALERHLRGRRRRRHGGEGGRARWRGRRRSVRRPVEPAVVISDPQGATFIASQFVFENKDLGPVQEVAARRLTELSPRCPNATGYVPGAPAGWMRANPPGGAQLEFYGGLFGWEFEDAMPPSSEWQVLPRPGRVARLVHL